MMSMDPHKWLLDVKVLILFLLFSLHHLILTSIYLDIIINSVLLIKNKINKYCRIN